MSQNTLSCSLHSLYTPAPHYCIYATEMVENLWRSDCVLDSNNYSQCTANQVLSPENVQGTLSKQAGAQ
ncbi:hypothetical protein DV515_00014003 [Chloebia gouldiae]|uniref:Uncharacterized protein n=1 Tax=Chloebia gouldiae TaxID=44316 RepID=A0A3L8S0N5_CHLGU|nr:hypothetical protein DV515_00014003 [Chloebia gouldiae]